MRHEMKRKKLIEVEKERERKKRRNQIRFCRKISEWGGVVFKRKSARVFCQYQKQQQQLIGLRREHTHQPTLRLLLLLLPLLLLTVLPLPLPRPVEHKVGHILVDDKGNRTGGCDAQQVGHDALVETWNALIAEEGRGRERKE